MQPVDSIAMRFDFAKLFAIQHSQVLDAIGILSLTQLLKPRNLLETGCHNQLAALFERNSVLPAERFMDAAPATQLRAFSDPALVVETGVDDSTVMSGLVSSHAIFLLHDDQVHLLENAA